MGKVRDGFAIIDLKTGAVEPMVMPEADIPQNRFNDGKVDGNGRYWAGSMDDGEKRESGRLYRLDSDLSLHKMDDNYITTARHLLNDEDVRKYPLSGSLFSCKPGVTGLPTPLFAG